MKNLTTQEQRDELQKVIQVELLKRGYTAQIIKFEENETNSRFIFKTENFQTTPVMFQEIYISNFNSSLEKDELIKDDKTHFVTRFWVEVNCFITHFNSEGKNSFSLFDVQGTFYDKQSRISQLNII